MYAGGLTYCRQGYG